MQKGTPGGARYARLAERRSLHGRNPATGIHPGLVNNAWNYEKEGHGCPGHRVAQPQVTFHAKIPAATSPFDIGLYTVSGISMTDKRVWRASGCAVKRKSNDPREIYRICAPFRRALPISLLQPISISPMFGIVTVTAR